MENKFIVETISITYNQILTSNITSNVTFKYNINTNKYTCFIGNVEGGISIEEIEILNDLADEFKLKVTNIINK